MGMGIVCVGQSIYNTVILFVYHPIYLLCAGVDMGISMGTGIIYIYMRAGDSTVIYIASIKKQGRSSYIYSFCRGDEILFYILFSSFSLSFFSFSSS